jgi:hypothetical protein
MDKFDEFLNEKPRPIRPSNKPNKDLIWNVLTGLMLLLSAGTCVFFISLVGNPYSAVNPFAPNTLIPPPATATWTPIGYDPTWTPTVTVQPTETNTPRPTYTLEASATPYKVRTSTPSYSPTPSFTPTRTPHPIGAPYLMTVTYNASTTFIADSNCSSMFVAGQALDANNKPVIGLYVKLGGRVPGKNFSPVLTTLTGIDKVYGQSGFEFNLKVAPVNSTQTLWVQLVDQSDAPLSDQYKLATYASCNKNLVLIRFQQK